RRPFARVMLTAPDFATQCCKESWARLWPTSGEGSQGNREVPRPERPREEGGPRGKHGFPRGSEAELAGSAPGQSPAARHKLGASDSCGGSLQLGQGHDRDLVDRQLQEARAHLPELLRVARSQEAVRALAFLVVL